jgi:hypothetical protein
MFKAEAFPSFEELGAEAGALTVWVDGDHTNVTTTIRSQFGVDKAE